jgi:excisionase family DNA binding protein
MTQVRAILGIADTTLDSWADAGRLPATRTPGGHRRFRASDVERLRVELGRPAVEPPPRTLHTPPWYGRRRRVLSAGEFAALADVDVRTVRRWADTGVLPPVTVTPGGHRRWRPRDVYRFLDRHQLRPSRAG